MLKTITQVGNAQGLIFDNALKELTHLQLGDEVNITVHEGAITLTPIRKASAAEAMNNAIEQTVNDFARSLRKRA